jgi:hypothetical protein
MDKKTLIEGYRKVINGIYGGKEYYKRVQAFIKRFTPNQISKDKLSVHHFLALFRSFIRLGIFDIYRKHYWGLFIWTLFHRPKMVPLAVTYSIYGYHFRKIFKENV